LARSLSAFASAGARNFGLIHDAAYVPWKVCPQAGMGGS
jgi:hypothetical protein